MVKAEISFGSEIRPFPQSTLKGIMAYMQTGLGDKTRIQPVVVDEFAPPFKVLSEKRAPNRSHKQIIFSLPPQKEGNGQDIEISSRVTWRRETLTRVGSVVFERKKPFWERLPLIRQFTERSEIRKDRKGVTRRNVLSFTKDCIANGMLRSQEEVNTFLRKMLGSDSELLTADLEAALKSEMIIWGINVPLGTAILAASGGNVELAFAAGVVTQGLVRFPWWFRRTKEEMGLLLKKKKKSRGDKMKIAGFGAMYGLILFTNFAPAVGSGPILILSAPRNTEYVLKNIELRARKGMKRVREFGENILGAL